MGIEKSRRFLEEDHSTFSGTNGTAWKLDVITSGQHRQANRSVRCYDAFSYSRLDAFSQILPLLMTSNVLELQTHAIVRTVEKVALSLLLRTSNRLSVKSTTQELAAFLLSHFVNFPPSQSPIRLAEPFAKLMSRTEQLPRLLALRSRLHAPSRQTSRQTSSIQLH